MSKPLVAAAVACFNSEGKLLIGYRPDKEAWCFPAGKQDPEDRDLPYVTAIRELYEESGMTPTLLQYIGAIEVQPEGDDGGVVHLYCFECRADGEPTGVNDPDGEFTKFAWVDVTEGYPHDEYPIYPKVNGLLGLIGLSDEVGKPIDDEESQPKPALKKSEAPPVVYRGITHGEHEYMRTHGHIMSDQRYCAAGEGTCYGNDHDTAEGYVNFGHTNPISTKSPTYVVGVSGGPELRTDPRDGYIKTSSPIPTSRIVSVHRYNPDGTVEAGKWSNGFVPTAPAQPHPWRNSPMQWGIRG